MKRRSDGTAALWAILLVGVALRFLLLTRQSLWYDEAASLELSDGASLAGTFHRVSMIHSGDSYQPLYYLVLNLWRRFVGESPFALRALSALFGSVTIGILALTARRWFGDRHATWVALYLTTSSFAIYYSQETRSYAMLLMLTALQLFWFRPPRPDESSAAEAAPARAAFGLITGTLAFASVLSLIPTAVLALVDFGAKRGIRAWARWWVPAALATVPALLYYASISHLTSPGAEHVAVTRSGFPLIQNILFVGYGALVGTSYGPSIEGLRSANDMAAYALGQWPLLAVLVVTGAALGTLIILALLPNRAGSGRGAALGRLLLALLAGSFLLAIVFAWGSKINWLPRHSYYLFVPLALLLPLAAPGAEIPGRRARAGTIGTLAFGSLIGMNCLSDFHYYFDARYRKDDYREAAAYVLQHASAREPSVMLLGRPRLLAYYGDSLTIDGRSLDRATLADELARVTNGADSVIVLVNREFDYKLPGGQSLVEALRPRYRLVSQVSPAFFSLYRFERSDEPGKTSTAPAYPAIDDRARRLSRAG
jgi:hypothetical protein